MTLRKLVIKKIAFGIALLALILCASSCKQNPDTQKDDNSKKTVVTSPEGFGFVFIEETTEKLDEKDYTVKAYADSYGTPYLYDYYKYYYLEGKLKKIHVYYHNKGQADYTYEEFKNYIKTHSDFGIYEEKIYSYYDSGRLQEIENWYHEFQNDEFWHYSYKYYDTKENQKKCHIFYYPGNQAPDIHYYYKNGKVGLYKGWGLQFYYESGFIKYDYDCEYKRLRTYDDDVYSPQKDIGSSEEYLTEEAYTEEQAEALCTQLLQQYFSE